MFFFFSSRRRHTRSLRDWSSDVCSSDLAAPPIIPDPAAQRLAMLVHAGAIDIAAGRTATDDRRAPETGPFLRSEEHTSELQSRRDLVCRLLLEKKKQKNTENNEIHVRNN